MATVGATQPFATISKKPLLVAGILLALALLLAVWWWWGGRAERVAIADLDPQERAALYQRTLQNLRSTCEPPERPRGLDDYCRRQADFILKFPECDSACRSLANRQSNQPSR